jgi:RNA polymerase-binding transcription factor DksA
MATKKQPPKKAAPKKGAPAKKVAVKAARPAVKTTKAPVKSAPKKGIPVKAAPKKAAMKTAPKKVVSSKPAPKAAPKKAMPMPAVAKKSVPAPQAPVKPVAKETVKTAPVKTVAKAAEPVKKPAVAAPTPQEIKPAIKPLAPAPKKEAPKPTKVVIPKTSTTKAVKYEPDFMKSVLDARQQVQTGPTMRYSDAELQEFRELIMRKLETAKKELAYLQGLITRKDEGGDMEDGRYMTMEDGSMSMEREQLSQMASRQIQFIDHLEKAIMRIENKTYGVCRVTGKLIDKARLRAVPHATLSIEAKQMMNK